MNERTSPCDVPGLCATMNRHCRVCDPEMCGDPNEREGDTHE
jgi:hypothetical protein